MRILNLAILTFALLAAVPVGAVPVQVTFTLFDYGGAYLPDRGRLGTGGFIFDSDFFVPHGQLSTVSGDQLLSAVVDITAGPHAGQHWDITSVTLNWADLPLTPPDGIGMAGYAWGWWCSTSNGPSFGGADGLTEFLYDDVFYGLSWNADVTSLPEPPSMLLFAAGLMTLFRVRHRTERSSDMGRRVKTRQDHNLNPGSGRVQ